MKAVDNYSGEGFIILDQHIQRNDSVDAMTAKCAEIMQGNQLPERFFCHHFYGTNFCYTMQLTSCYAAIRPKDYTNLIFQGTNIAFSLSVVKIIGIPKSGYLEIDNKEMCGPRGIKLLRAIS